MTEADVDDPPPLLTLLDLWYTAFGQRQVHFLWTSLEDLDYDDWLMQNMALVVNRVMREAYLRVREQRIVSEGPYRVSMYIDQPMSLVRVVVFMENKDGNCREQSAAYSHAQP